MKLAIVITVTAFHLSSFAQTVKNDAKFWLPEKYVNAALAGDSVNIRNYLNPVEGFVTSGTDLLILTYIGEEGPIRYQTVTNNKKLLTNVHRYMNLQYVPRDSVSLYSKSKFLVSREGDRLLLEIETEGKHRKIYYVSGAGDYEFDNLHSAKDKLERTARGR